jgi:hypothetical protein
MRMQDAAEEVPPSRPAAYIPLAATLTMFPDNVISDLVVWVLRINLRPTSIPV